MLVDRTTTSPDVLNVKEIWIIVYIVSMSYNFLSNLSVSILRRCPDMPGYLTLIKSWTISCDPEYNKVICVSATDRGTCTASPDVRVMVLMDDRKVLFTGGEENWSRITLTNVWEVLLTGSEGILSRMTIETYFKIIT